MFGCTLIGYRSYLRGHQNDGYVEPCYLETKAPSEQVPVPTDPEAFKGVHQPILKSIDIYYPLVDGFAYCSADRLRNIRRKHLRRPTGVKDEFRVPVTANMNYGWQIDDEQLGEWTRVRDPAPRESTDATKWFSSLRPVERLCLKM